MATEVNWEDPPPSATRPGRRAGGRYGALAAALRAEPGKSARIDDFPSDDAARIFAGHVERGKRKGFGKLVADAKGKSIESPEPGGFVAYSEGKSVWVQYVAPDAEDD